MAIKLAFILSFVVLCFGEVSGFVFEVKQATGHACDNIGGPILNGQRSETFSMKQKLEHGWMKGPCVTVIVPSKGVRLMATRGGMIMVFREGIAIYGTHRNHFSKSRPSSGFSSPTRSPRSITPTLSGSSTPQIFRSKDGSVVERRQPKIPPKSQVVMNSSSSESPRSNVPKRKISRTVTDLSPQSSFEISSSPNGFRHISPQASLEVKTYVPGLPEVSSPSSSESSSTPRLLRTSESKGTLELLIDHYASITKAERIEAVKEPTKVRSRSQSFSPGLAERTKPSKQRPRNELISSGEIGVKKSVSSPLSASEKRRRKTKPQAPDLELTLSGSSSSKRSSSTKSLSASSTKRSSPRTGSESNTSPRSLGDSPKHSLLDPNYSAETSPRSINSSNSSGSNSRQNSPRSLAESGFYKNVDVNVQLELEDLILLVIPNVDADASVVLEMYLSASDKLDEIDRIKMSTIGQLVLLKVTEPVVEPEVHLGRLVKRRSKSYSTPISGQFEPELTKISQESHSIRQ